jgi:acid phosphatase
MRSTLSLSLLLSIYSGLVAGSASASEPAESTVQPPKTAIDAAAATQSALSPVSDVKGAAFDRFYQVWLENTDYSSASGATDQK